MAPIFKPKGIDCKSISDFNSDWADRIAYLILLGLAFDIGSEFVSAPIWSKLIAIVGDISIWAGVFGELLFAKRARTADDSRVAKAEKALAEAIDRATALEHISLPRRLSPQDKTKIAGILETVAASLHVHIEFQSGDPEAFIFANDIAEAFRRSGCPPISGGPNSFPHEVVLGVNSSAESPALETQIRTAFALVEIPCRTRFWNPLWMQPIPQTAPRRNVRIFVGPKPPPDLPFPYTWTAKQSDMATTTDSAARE